MGCQYCFVHEGACVQKDDMPAASSRPSRSPRRPSSRVEAHLQQVNLLAQLASRAGAEVPGVVQAADLLKLKAKALGLDVTRLLADTLPEAGTLAISS